MLAEVLDAPRMSKTTMPGRERDTSSSATIETDMPSGPLSGPSNTTWRRNRLLRIGAESPPNELLDESAPLTQRRPGLRMHHSSYGTLPLSNQANSSARSSFRTRHGLPALPTLAVHPRTSISNPATPHPLSAPSERSYFRISTQRPISAYDAPLAVKSSKSDDLLTTPDDLDAKTNGVRVWYSSFSSIDWLHDAIKDSARLYRLRRRKSFRGRARNAFDRSIGWLIVSIVGFLTAIAAFLIVRAEQWLFDVKDGYCAEGWWRAKRFCCQVVDEDDLLRLVAVAGPADACRAWKSWGQLLTNRDTEDATEEAVEYVAYAAFAVRHCPPISSPDT